MNELRLLTQSDNEFIIKVYFAFQDYENLYLVSEALDSLSFEQIL
jgi:serine/threonine protein kinase